jgi:uncharacterized protein (DUF1778 family)
MGRKAMSGEPKTDKPLRIRLTDDERDVLDRAAALDGMPTSTWLRALGIDVARRRLKSRRKA